MKDGLSREMSNNKIHAISFRLKGNNDTLFHTSLATIIGLGLFWPSLHGSPYYPLSLSLSFGVSGLLDISIHHIIYSLLLIFLFILLIAAREKIMVLFSHVPYIAIACGCAGLVGSLLLAVPDKPNTVAAGVGLVLVAVYVSSFIVTWLTAMMRYSLQEIAVKIACSYSFFCVMWLVVLLLHIDKAIFLCGCPLISAVCLATQSIKLRTPRSDKSSTLKALPRNIVILCIVCIYFGVICVRVLTAMQQGADVAGDLPLLHQVTTAVIGLVISAAIALYFHKKDYSLNSLITGFTFLALIYMVALLMVMLGSTADTLSILGKRTLVAAEHCMEVFLAIILTCTVSKKHFSPILVFSLYALIVLVAPQLISLDLMYQSGLLEAVSRIDLILPLSAVTSFAVAVISIGLLISHSSKVVKSSGEQTDAWEENICRLATDGIDISPREFEVVVLTYRGYSARKTAEELYVSESTVKTHISSVYRKLDIHSKQELIDLVDGYR